MMTMDTPLCKRQKPASGIAESDLMSLWQVGHATPASDGQHVLCAAVTR
jgi:uncharacterized protein YsxB (DUF464 family)